MTRLRIVLLLAVLVGSPAPAAAQWWKALVPDLADLSGAWGDEARTIDGGVGYSWWKLNLALGASIVERGLKPGHQWSSDRTRVYDDQGTQVDPRDARTDPRARPWARLEAQHGWRGLALVWDPREEVGVGGFAVLPLGAGMELHGEARWLRDAGWLGAIRIRFR